MTRALIVAVVVLGGCTDLPAVPGGTCGNGVVDDNEDCDSNNNCSQCRRVCTTDAECIWDGADGTYVCGADNICHAPSGVFTQQPVTTFPLVVGQGSVADLDGDKIGDIVGFSDITINVHFGDLEASLATHASELLPYSNTNIALREFGRQVDHDGDPATPEQEIRVHDILVPTPDGIVAYTATASQAIVAYPFASSAMGPHSACASNDGSGEPVAVFTLDEQHIAFVVRARSDGSTTLGVVDVFDGACTKTSVCNLVAQEPGPLGPAVYYDHYATTTSGLLTSMIAIGVVVSPGEQRVCVVRFNEADPATASTLTRVSDPEPLAAASGPITFARAVPGATPPPCPALFTGRPPVGTMPDGIDYYDPLGTATDCTVALTGIKLGLDPITIPAGRIPLQPPIPGRGPDALAIISSYGFSAQTTIVSLDGPTTTFMYQSPRPLYPIRSADLDGDGRIEGIASVYAGGPQGEPDLDILYRTATPLEGFIPYRISTQGVPTHLAVGDFDGNLLFDIAYIERLGQDERLMIAYGTRDRPLPAIEIAKFGSVVALGQLDLRDSIDQNGGVLDDLVVADDQLDAGPPLITLLHGNPQRSMLAYYDPRPPGSAAANEQFFAAVTGNFIETTPASDLAALYLGGTTVSLYVAEGEQTSQRFSELTTPLVLSGIEGPACLDASLQPTSFCTNGAEYHAWPITGRDVVIAVEGERPALAEQPPATATRKLATIDPVTGAVTLASDASTLIPAAAFVFAVHDGDVDADLRRDLVVSFGSIGPFASVAPEVRVCRVSDQGSVETCRSVAESTAFSAGSWRCRSGEVGRFSARGRHDPPPTTDADDLVVLCESDGASRVFRFAPQPDRSFQAEPVLANAGGYQILSSGDVNGDGLTDLIGVAFDPSNTPIINIHLQCDAVDMACRDKHRIEVTP